MIDDLDRLDSESIRLLLRLIRLKANLPNTMYILPFDRMIVASALAKEQQGIDGQSYLEKIVQLGLEIPDTTPEQLYALFFEGLDKVLNGTPENEWDNDYWGNLFLGGLRNLLKTPRDVVRCLNSICCTFPMVCGEVNPVDFVAMEFLRTFRPDVYSSLRDNRSFVLEPVPSSGSNQIVPESLKLYLTKTPEDENGPISRIIVQLFPRLSQYVGNWSFGPDWDKEWRANKRICSPTYFDTYFRWQVPQGALPDGQLKSILLNAEDQDYLRKQLAEISANNQIVRMTEYATDHISVITTKGTINFLTAIFDIADSISDESALFAVSPRYRVLRLADTLFDRITDLPQRDELLLFLIESSPCLSSLVDYVARQERIGEKTEKLTFSDEALTKAKSMLLARIKQSGNQGTLLNLPDILNILFRWRDWSTTAEVSDFLNIEIQTDTGLLGVLVAFMKIVKSTTFGFVYSTF